MHVVQLPPPADTGATMRCECAFCGAHVEVRRSWQLSGWCQNCRRHELRPLVAAAPPVAPAPVPAPVLLTRAEVDPTRVAPATWLDAQVA